MMGNLKDKLWYLFVVCLRKFMEALFFAYEIIRHPIKNISIWLVGLLALLIYGNLSIGIKGKDMFVMSAGLVSIITFISNFLEKQTIDIDNKDNFYLGYNIKKLKFHKNFWLKKFNELPVKLLFWAIAIIPIITIFVELKYKSKVLNEMVEIIVAHIKYIDSIWLATFIVSSFYCTAILIESVNLSRKNFSQSYLYNITNNFERRIIKIEIERYFKEMFNNIFNIKSRLGLENNFYSNVESVINCIVNTGDAVSASDSEIIEFYNIAFECEGNKIDDVLSKVYKYAECKKDKKIKFFIYTHMLSKILELLKLYYHTKWNMITKLHVLPSRIINIAIQDLKRLLKIETKLHGNKEYENIFWEIYTRNENYFREDKKSNFCISKICEILEKKFRDIKFLDCINNMDTMMNLFDVLNKIDSQIEEDRYFSPIFSTIFKHTIDNKNVDNEFVQLFYDEMKKQGLPEYLISKRNEVTKNILLSGYLISNDILEYLLGFIQLEDAIVVLIFRLAYSKRSGRGIMTVDEFKVWKSAFNKLTVRKDIDELKESKFIDEICREISKSDVSHFIFCQFIKWMWSSLFEKFDEKKYEEFIRLGKEGIRRNFSLDSYIIVRLLLCNYYYRSLSVYEFKKKANKKQIKIEVNSIKDILNLNKECVYI
ncbi:hypothetical protein [Finegoldia magna]|uniref:hypothetical protein n=1 Tax=Finegoldia magna TaxID=1260 RepID=UPI0026EDC64F|nr:hypothetical protein [Finegoldia magna]